MTYYVVTVGHQPGIYTDTKEFSKSVYKFKGAKFKKFTDPEKAQQWFSQNYRQSTEPMFSLVTPAPENKAAGDEPPTDKPYAYIDGSYNPLTKRYGYGAFLVVDGEKTILQGYDKDPQTAELQQVPGELFGCVAVVKEAISRGLKELIVYYDFLGIQKFLTGEWNSDKRFILQYQRYMRIAAERIHIRFRHVRGHSGNAGNNEADRLAKQAVGISVKKKERWLLIEVKNREIKTYKFPNYSTALEEMSCRVDAIRYTSVMRVQYQVDLFSAWCDAGAQYNWKIVQIL